MSRFRPSHTSAPPRSPPILLQAKYLVEACQVRPPTPLPKTLPTQSVITLRNASVRLFPASSSSCVAAAAGMDLVAPAAAVAAAAEGGRLLFSGISLLNRLQCAAKPLFFFHSHFPTTRHPPPLRNKVRSSLCFILAFIHPLLWLLFAQTQTIAPFSCSNKTSGYMNSQMQGNQL